jgi:hypothetical protein
MGTKLFGVNISGILRSATKGRLVPIVLTKYTPSGRDPNDLGSGLGLVGTDYTCEGFIEDPILVDGGTGMEPRAKIVNSNRLVTIIGDSLPTGVEPFGDPEDTAPADKVAIDGRTYYIVRVQTDPAKATYLCYVKAGA